MVYARNRSARVGVGGEAAAAAGDDDDDLTSLDDASASAK
jgi:hypothetical protein